MTPNSLCKFLAVEIRSPKGEHRGKVLIRIEFIQSSVAAVAAAPAYGMSMGSGYNPANPFQNLMEVKILGED